MLDSIFLFQSKKKYEEKEKKNKANTHNYDLLPSNTHQEEKGDQSDYGLW
jgi:hypothetical protein